MRRVVITGLGLVSPLASGVEETWKRLIAGDSGARRVTEFEVDDLPCQIACRIPLGDGTNGTFNPDLHMEPKEQRKVDPFIVYAVGAADQALDDANWHPESDEDQIRTGVLIGSGIGGIEGIVDAGLTLRDKGPRRISPFFIPGRLINLASGHVSIKHKLRGPNHSVVTACATGTHAIGDAARLIAFGDADVMVAGGTESPVSRISLAGFAACKALSTKRNDDPTAASRPYDSDRDGFVMGEGAGVVVLEELEHALARGAKIYAEVIGYGLSGDAYHITAPTESGEGAERCMIAAIKRAEITPDQIDYINAHGTSTMADTIELGAVERVVGDAASKVSMSSTKSSIGHLLGAAGAAEAIFSTLAIRDNIAPATLNLDNPAIETKIDLVPHKARERKIDIALSNSFGFGGTNASLVLRRYS
ncbi:MULTISPECIES: beta-ketoacyl-ACP synthase II [Ochrobactrum]|jgi:3-oxoacyl-[acyl-carrier-protein] synthase II|uniref:3-oxoacyl-[acyl-carrier-protein] synthase 2 n=1 Tax=Ochrobactrum quorumnocens TaxID=271865 RepID=A0A248UHB7_9HYPH|nr:MULTISPECIES: beta-ketoacyl-ACP synthase II [Brucella/Ochrobactrum group]MBD7990429.1 beta-ketoacyl-ACP synthase II [Ochrobactrum gallinarum]ASV86022.1 beta-ketoacyl-acyl-carrier-protein synthase II [[Ochrobactrum] quorumnocens]KAA9370514.1 beta-ketoacyl-ACP synthase II [[Ochrobactrum] quorumnocens]MCV9908908.1 beta-ketoacyl-ACP synthase II [Brucella sp. HL-2]MDH7792840.1 3-oxoacyl-[acyl-carrier-protein] synthase II [Ochrobactrum sp. AN78]